MSTSDLEPLPYHRDILAYLREEDPEVWQWFASQPIRKKASEEAKLDLLKSTYRMERESHSRIYGIVDEAREKLGLDIPVTLYQGEGAGQLNLFLSYMPGEGHLGMLGPVQDILSEEELRYGIGHELSHYVLYDRDGGDHFVCQQVLNALANDGAAQPAHVESFRAHMLTTEIYADRGGLRVAGTLDPCVTALVKLNTGLREVDAASYLRQAEEILSKERGGSKGMSHPETFMRVRALRLWAAGAEGAGEEVRRLIEGTPALERLDLLGRRRMERLTRRLIDALLAPRWFRSEAVIAHARLFFPEFEAPSADGDVAGLRAELGTVEEEKLRDYLCYVMLDFAAADPDLDDAPFAAAFRLAGDEGLGDRLVELAAREFSGSKKRFEKLRKDADRILSRVEGGKR